MLGFLFSMMRNTRSKSCAGGTETNRVMRISIIEQTGWASATAQRCVQASTTLLVIFGGDASQKKPRAGKHKRGGAVRCAALRELVFRAPYLVICVVPVGVHRCPRPRHGPRTLLVIVREKHCGTW
jgi:hypothetical protein